MDDKRIDEEIQDDVQNPSSTAGKYATAGYGLTSDDIAQYAPYVEKPHSSIWDYLTGNSSKQWQDYYQKIRELKMEADSLASARAYENTAIQRQVEDMKRAGLNPYWLTSSTSGASSDSSSRNSYPSRSSSAKNQDAKSVGDLMRLLGVLLVVAAHAA